MRRLVPLAVLLALVAIALWRTEAPGPPRGRTVEPRGIMGTSCRLVAVAAEGRSASALDPALVLAEGSLRRDESVLSEWMADSEIGRLNAAPAGSVLELSELSRSVVSLAHEAHQLSGGVFDATIGPLIDVWREAGRAGRLPGAAAIEAARESSRWDRFVVDGPCVHKTDGSARLALGGIAKGLAIDRALSQLRSAGADEGGEIAGGLVEVGGDLRVFGSGPDGKPWSVEVRSPFSTEVVLLARLRVGDGAICTSGNYARFHVIEGRRYSHILDPRTGRPAEATPSVTVLAPSAAWADVWATALSVLGEEGLALLPEGVEALLVLGDADAYELVATEGMVACLEETPERLRVRPASG